MQRSSRQIATVVGTVGLIAAVLAFGSVSRPAPTRYVMIHTDDAGVCEAVNAATINALERRIVTSTSILVCAPGFEKFADYAAAHPEWDYGVHLNLTCETSNFHWGPVLKKDEVPSLVNANGYFWRSVNDVIEHVALDDAERELRAQIQKALDAGIRISHLDHHMWVLYSRPDLMELYVKLSREFDLPVRFERNPPQDDVVDHGPEVVAAFYKCRDLLKARGMPVFDFIETNNYPIAPDEKRAYYIQQLRQLPPGISEFVIHCSSDMPGKLQPPHVDRRVADTQVFTSDEIEEELRRLGIQTVNYKQIRAMFKR